MADRLPPALAAEHLTKDYGDLVALEPLDLVIPDGQRVVLVGHNGSGKTTLLRMAAGLLEPSDGTVEIVGRRRGPSRPGPRCRTCPTTRCSTTTCRSSSTSSTPAGCTRPTDWEERAVALLGDLGLTARADDLPSRFSRGLRQKTAILLGADPALRGADGRRALRRPRPGGTGAFIELLDDAAAAGRHGDRRHPPTRVRRRRPTAASPCATARSSTTARPGAVDVAVAGGLTSTRQEVRQAPRRRSRCRR